MTTTTQTLENATRKQLADYLNENFGDWSGDWADDVELKSGLPEVATYTITETKVELEVSNNQNEYGFLKEKPALETCQDELEKTGMGTEDANDLAVAITENDFEAVYELSKQTDISPARYLEDYGDIAGYLEYLDELA